MSKFFNRKWKAGFTLVELIVVIAILAVLAGIAIPVYSGYIKKANKAADLQLLGAVNTAFAAACLENGFNAKDVDSASLTVSSERKITGVSDVSLKAGVTPLTTKTGGYGPALLGAHLTQLAADDLDAKVNDSFIKYFGENKNTPLKCYESGDQFELVDGVFVPVEDESTTSKTMRTWTDAYGNTVTYTQEDIDAYKASSFYNTDIADWAGTVDTLVSGVSANSASMDALKKDAGFASYLASKGVDADDDMAVATALVTYAASKLSTVDATAVADVIRNGGDNWSSQINQIASMMGGQTFANKAVAAAFMFGLSGGYANTDAGLNDSAAQALYSGGVSDLGSFTTFMNSLDQTKYQNYLQSDQLVTDIAGFVGVLGTVDDNYDVLMEYLSNNYGEFNNTDVTDLVAAILSGGGD